MYSFYRYHKVFFTVTQFSKYWVFLVLVEPLGDRHFLVARHISVLVYWCIVEIENFSFLTIVDYTEIHSTYCLLTCLIWFTCGDSRLGWPYHTVNWLKQFYHLIIFTSIVSVLVFHNPGNYPLFGLNVSFDQRRHIFYQILFCIVTHKYTTWRVVIIALKLRASSLFTCCVAQLYLTHSWGFHSGSFQSSWFSLVWGQVGITIINHGTYYWMLSSNLRTRLMDKEQKYNHGKALIVSMQVWMSQVLILVAVWANPINSNRLILLSVMVSQNIS